MKQESQIGIVCTIVIVVSVTAFSIYQTEQHRYINDRSNYVLRTDQPTQNCQVELIKYHNSNNQWWLNKIICKNEPSNQEFSYLLRYAELATELNNYSELERAWRTNGLVIEQQNGESVSEK